MNFRSILPIAIFVVAIVLLNFFFQLDISIIGSLVLTVVLNLVLNLFARRS